MTKVNAVWSAALPAAPFLRPGAGIVGKEVVKPARTFNGNYKIGVGRARVGVLEGKLQNGVIIQNLAMKGLEGIQRIIAQYNVGHKRKHIMGFYNTRAIFLRAQRQSVLNRTAIYSSESKY